MQGRQNDSPLSSWANPAGHSLQEELKPKAPTVVPNRPGVQETQDDSFDAPNVILPCFPGPQATQALSFSTPTPILHFPLGHFLHDSFCANASTSENVPAEQLKQPEVAFQAPSTFPHFPREQLWQRLNRTMSLGAGIELA